MKRYRTKKGSAFVELSIFVFLLIIFAGMAVDTSMILLGIGLNELACRDAARAAGGQSNPTSALAAAQSELAMHLTDGKIVSKPVLVGTTSPNFVYQDYTGNPPVNTSPYVFCQTVVNIDIPGKIQLGKVSFPPRNLTFFSSYRYPLVKEHFYAQ